MNWCLVYAELISASYTLKSKEVLAGWRPGGIDNPKARVWTIYEKRKADNSKALQIKTRESKGIILPAHSMSHVSGHLGKNDCIDKTRTKETHAKFATFGGNLTYLIFLSGFCLGTYPREKLKWKMVR